MKKIFELFMSNFDIYLLQEKQIQPLKYPAELIDQLKIKSNMGIFMKRVKVLAEKCAINRMKVLSVLALLMIHSNEFYTAIELLLPVTGFQKDNDKWLDQTFLNPFQQYLLKCCSSSQKFQQLKYKSASKSQIPLPTAQQTIYQQIFYLINLLKKMLESLQKIANLGRYYQKDYPIITDNYIYICNLHVSILYNALKKYLLNLVRNKQLYLFKISSQKIFRQIIDDQLLKINQELKKVIFSKYYNPYQKGIRTILFINEQQSPQTRQIIESIIQTHRLEQQRSRIQKSIVDLKASFRSESSIIINNNNLKRQKRNISHGRGNMSIGNIGDKYRSKNIKSDRSMKFLNMLKLKKMSTLQEMEETDETTVREKQIADKNIQETYQQGIQQNQISCIN